MGWDYIHDGTWQPVDPVINKTALGNWTEIEVELQMQKERRIPLTKKEWRLLNAFIGEHDNVEITPKDFEHLPKNVRVVIRDWVAFKSKPFRQPRSHRDDE